MSERKPRFKNVGVELTTLEGRVRIDIPWQKATDEQHAILKRIGAVVIDLVLAENAVSVQPERSNTHE